MRKQIATIHQEQVTDDANHFWIDANCFWGVDGRGATVEEAISNYLTNVVNYCNNYYRLDLWQIDNRVTQLDNVDYVLQLIKSGDAVANFFDFRLPSVTALAS